MPLTLKAGVTIRKLALANEATERDFRPEITSVGSVFPDFSSPANFFGNPRTEADSKRQFAGIVSGFKGPYGVWTSGTKGEVIKAAILHREDREIFALNYPSWKAHPGCAMENAAFVTRLMLSGYPGESSPMQRMLASVRASFTDEKDMLSIVRAADTQRTGDVDPKAARKLQDFVERAVLSGGHALAGTLSASPKTLATPADGPGG